MVATLLTGPAQATVVFNWVRSGVPAGNNQFVPFAVAVSDQTYLSAVTSPVTFGAYSARIGVEQSGPNYLNVVVGSPDVQSAVRVQSEASGTFQIVSVASGLNQCNSPPWYSVSCRVGFNSSAFQPNEAFTGFFKWGGGLLFTSGNQTSTLALQGNSLSVNFSFIDAVLDGPVMTTDTSGAGSFVVMAEGEQSPLRGTGFWTIDASTIPSAVPLPPSAWLMALGLAGVALRTRRA